MHACPMRNREDGTVGRVGGLCVCSVQPPICALQGSSYTVTNSYTQGSPPDEETPTTEMRHRRDPGTPRGGAGRRGSEPRAAEARGEGEHIHAPTHNLTQSQKAGPNRIKNNTTADASVVASPVSQGRIRTEGKRPKGSKQGRLTVRGNDRHRNWSLDAVLTWRAQRGKPTRRVQLSSHA